MSNQIITIDNFPRLNIAEETVLSVAAASAQDDLTLESADGFAINSYTLVGEIGGEVTELMQAQTVTGEVVDLTANLVNDHVRGEAVHLVKNNQAKIYRAANVDGSIPLDASFSVLGTVSLQGDQVYTEYTDTAGGSGYWYKFIYWNSTTSTGSSITDAVAIRGGNYGHYAGVEDVRDEAGMRNNRWITDQIIYQKLVGAESEVNASIVIGGYTLPLESPYPEMVVNATILLAAGYLLLKDFGVGHEGTNKDGKGKIAEAREILKKIELGGLLLDPTTNEPVSSSDAVRGYPDDSHDDPAFSMSDKY